MNEVRALIASLVEKGIDPLDAAEIITRAAIHGAASAPKERSAGAIRQERYRRNKASQVTGGDGCGVPSSEGSSPIPPSPNLQPLPPSPPKGGSSPTTPRSELETVLDCERAAAVIEHRQRLRKPLTARAAKLLANQFAKFPDPNAAADRMIERGWLSIDAEWASSTPGSRATAPPQPQKPRNAGEFARMRLREMGELPDAADNQARYFDKGNAGSDSPSAGIARRFAIASGR